MLKQKREREKGKLKLSEYFKELKEGDRVAVIKNLSVPFNFPSRIHGKTGTVIGKKGRAFIVQLKDGNKNKKFILQASHLKKLKTS